MKPTEILSAEHRVIERVLGCLDKIADQASATGNLEADDARDAIDFLRNFADRCHHGKEEQNLFPAMEAQGFPSSNGPIAVMLHEHDEGRAHILAMDESVVAAAGGEPEALHRFVDHARLYTRLLYQHIQKEDAILFVLADRVLGPDEQQELLDRFQYVETEHMGHGTHEKYLALADRLALRYGVSPVPAAACVHCCGH
jgi:hemerythrin-like domain-containing protein